MQSADPMLLGEFISLADRKDRDSAAAGRPDVRVLTGAEEVHLASGRARQANLRRGRAGPGQDDREHGVGGIDAEDSPGSHAESNVGARDRARRFDLGHFAHKTGDEQSVERAPCEESSALE